MENKEKVSNYNQAQIETLKKIIEIIKEKFPDGETEQRELLSCIVNIQL